ncbi:hypothetical protein FPSE5266_01486 [Fusarium pseudograminearum]|nr:hypothetical protein FPSE5266_01486 [Fusarium pseudograminearum]
MWDTFKTGNGPSLHQQPPQELKNRPFLRQNRSSSSGLPQSRSTSSAHSNQTANSNKSRDDIYESQTHLHDEFENRLNGLGIQNGPFRYEIRRGKTVRTPDISGPPRLSPVLGSDDIRVKPPRNPQQLQGEDDSPWRPASSIYTNEDVQDRRSSRHSRYLQYLKPSHSKVPATDMYGRPMGVEISPPSSPEFDARQYKPNSQDVSPIDDSPNPSQLNLLGERRLTPSQSQAQLRSQIPQMRRDKPTSPGLSSQLRTTKSTDELTDASKPWENMHPSYYGSQKPFGSTTIVTGGQQSNTSPSLGQRIRKFARAKPEHFDTRPPWNGASGRAPMIDPVRDDPSVAPLSLRRKASKRIALSGGVKPETHSGNAGTVRQHVPSRPAQRSNETYKTPSPELVSHSYPSPPNTGSPPPSQPAMSQTATSMLTPNMVPDQMKAIRRKPSPSTHNPHSSWSSSVYSAITENTIIGDKSLLNPVEPAGLSTPEDPWAQPASRFSVTTCNTAAARSPVVPDEEERPDTPKQAPSVMDRRRPVPGGDNFRRASNVPIVISMKSASPSNEHFDSNVSTDKALPPAPPELQSAHDRVAYLTARLDSLAHRRNNINKSIKQMTELMPTDRILSSTEVMRKREIEKKKVEGLKEELAEIQREEHDLGLKLYRANKRAEREAAFEPSTLWVRRVTS